MFYIYNKLKYHKMNNKNKIVTYIAFVIVVCIITYMLSYQVEVNRQIANKSKDEFYKVTPINDSTIHFNMNDNSCAMVILWADTMKVSTHNSNGVSYDKWTHELTTCTKQDDQSFRKTVDLDLYFNSIPEDLYFILDIE